MIGVSADPLHDREGCCSTAAEAVDEYLQNREVREVRWKKTIRA